MSETPKHTHTTETENTPLLTWGEGYATAENYSPGFCCKNPECKEYEKNITERKNYVFDFSVGVQEAPAGLQKDEKHFALICECDSCFSRFWFHLRDEEIDNFKAFYEGGLMKKIKPKKIK